MTNYMLQPNETILYQGYVYPENRNGLAELILTNLNLVLITTIKKLFAKSQIDVDMYPVEEIKFYNNVPQIKQKNAHVEVFLISGIVAVQFESMFEATKFVNSARHLLTGKTAAERGADKVKGAVDLVDNTLGIDTVGTVKNVLENGLAGSLIGGFGKKTAPALKNSSTTREVVGLAKELLENKSKETLPSNTITAPTATTPTADQLETIKKLKELLDMGIITQEEFDAKKKQLLGL